jgi:hypothetical protein
MRPSLDFAPLGVAASRDALATLDALYAVFNVKLDRSAERWSP